jgi:endonuclease-3 related protein
MKIYQIYLSFLKKYGRPKDFWAKWCKDKKRWQDREEIAIGAILTQRTNWKNVELALENLRKEGVLSIEKIYQLKNRKKFLEKLIRPSGFYKQKARRLLEFSEFIIKKHKSLENFFKQDLEICRKELLEIYGIGPETADSILLYAGDLPIFVIDEYTRRLVKKFKLAKKFSYDHLRKLFQENLPKSFKIYQDFHALIVMKGKRMNKRVAD